MLDDHLEHSGTHNRELAQHHPDSIDLVLALRDDITRRDDPLHVDPLLQVELMLFVARTPELRPALGEHLRAMRRRLRAIGVENLLLEQAVVADARR